MTRSATLALFATLTATAAFAQQPTPPTPPTPPAFTMAVPRAPDPRKMVLRMDHDEGGSLGIVPPGTWWRNPETIKALALTADQQKRMDDIFRQNRIQLIHMKASLDEEQVNLEPLLNANPPDSGKALAVISKIADLRANLEKANAKMLLSLRAVLSADQWTKLQAQRPTGFLFDKGPFGTSTHTSTTTCTQTNGQPRKCFSSGGPKDGSLMLMMPRDPNSPPPPNFKLEIPDGDN